MAALTIKDKNSNPTSVLYDANKKTMVVYLPQGIILFQILTRVPTKSVIRFKCVSKQWNAFLMSDRFKQMHSRSLLTDPHLEDQNVFFYDEHEATFFTINCESPPDNAPCRRPLPQFEASPPDFICILTSYHGLVCLGTLTDACQDFYTSIILWNPLTTEYKRLSKPTNPDHMECYNSYGLYYSSCEDDYKLLVVTKSGNVYIYSLKSDSWRKLNKKAPEKERGSPWRPGFSLSENIYFLCHNIAQASIRFDTTAERFLKIEPPPGYDNNNNRCSTTIDVSAHRGSIHLCVKYDIIERHWMILKTCIDLWKFNADGDIWTKMVTYQLRPEYEIQCLSPLHLMNNGNWLMINYRYREGRICQVELKKKYTEDKDCNDEYKLLYYCDVKVDCAEEVKYTGTFVSPNQYMK